MRRSALKSHLGLLRQSMIATLLLSGMATAQTLPATCDLNELSSIPLRFTEDRRPLIDASINGHVVPAMVNIGAAQTTVLNKKTLERLGVSVRHVTSTVFRDEKDSRGDIVPGGQIEVREGMNALVKDYSAGQMQGKNMWFLVEDFMDDAFGARIGAGSLLHTDLELDLDAGYLKHFKPNGCFREHLASWDPDAVVVPAMVDPWKRDPRPVFRVMINGEEIVALLSTATPHSYLPERAAVRLGLSSTASGATREDPLPGHDASKPVWKVPVAAMSIGALEVKDFQLRLMDLSHAGELLILGADFLHRHRVYIALSQGKIYFTPIQKPAPKRGTVEIIPQPIES